jgi:N-methylhydantoinase B
LKYPVLVEELRMREDSEGAGRRRGAPGATCRYGPRWDDMNAIYVTDCVENPPRGTQGGGDAAANVAFKIDVSGAEVPLAPLASVVIAAGETIGQHSTGGGGYGSPLDREPARVRADVLSRFVSFARAGDVYGVVFTDDTRTDALTVDEAATAARRRELAAAS